MKKTLVILLMSLITLTAYSQDSNDRDSHYYDGIENRNNMGITAEQRNKIISIKKGIGRRYQTIGQDRSLTGYEKGQKKRELSTQIRKEIYDVLDSNQRTEWDNTASSNSSSRVRNDKTERDIDAIEDHIDDLEDEYDRKIKAVERDGSLSKAERKYKKQSLKDEFKAEKRKLKRQKEDLKDSRYY